MARLRTYRRVVRAKAAEKIKSTILPLPASSCFRFSLFILTPMLVAFFFASTSFRQMRRVNISLPSLSIRNVESETVEYPIRSNNSLSRNVEDINPLFALGNRLAYDLLANSAQARRQNAFIEARNRKSHGNWFGFHIFATARSAGTLSVTNLLVKRTLRTVFLVKTEPRVKNNRARLDRVITAFDLQ